MPASETVLVLLRPSGTAVNAWATGTGRKAPTMVRNRARRMLKELLPELFQGRRKTRVQQTGRKRRTSRAAQPSRKRRTSRRVG
jgi:hypothetical protein